MKKLEVAFALIEQGDNYLLQLRGNNPMIGGAGLIGCFGGKIESGETPKDTVTREIAEETSLKIKQKDFVNIGKVEVRSDHRLETVQVTAHVFKIQAPVSEAVSALEGELVIIAKDEVENYLDKMTTGTSACFERIIMKADK